MARLESVDNALRLILLLGRGNRMTVTQAAQTLGVAPSTAHRLLATLVYRDFAEQAPDRSYAAGPAIARIRVEHHARDRLVTVARPTLRALVATINETCHLAVLDGLDTRFLLSEEAHQALRIGSRVGQVMPAHLTAAGKILLAQLPTEEVDRRYPSGGLPERDLSSDAVAAFKRELATARRRGLAVNRGGTERGLHALAVAVEGPTGEAVAAITASLPSVRNTPGRTPDIVAGLREAGHRVAAALATEPLDVVPERDD